MGFCEKKRDVSCIEAVVGQRLRFFRLQKNLSQERLAKITGLSYQQIQKYEIGENRISAGRLYIFSHVLGIPIHQFFADERSCGEETPVSLMSKSIEIKPSDESVLNPKINKILKELVLEVTRITGDK